MDGWQDAKGSSGVLLLARLWLHALQLTVLTVPHPADGRTVTLRAAPGPEWGRWLPPGGTGPTAD